MAERKPRRPRASAQSRTNPAQEGGGSDPNPAEASDSTTGNDASGPTRRPKVPAPTPSAEERAESAFDVIGTYLHPGRENVMLIYILYLIGLVPAFGGIPIFVGFVMALLNRHTSDGIWTSHYEFQFRQAAIGLLCIIVSGVLVIIAPGALVIVVIGFTLVVLTAGWWIVRSVRGLQAASRDEPIDDPKTYSW